VADPVTLGLVGLAAAVTGPLVRSLEMFVRSRAEARLERARREALAEVLRAVRNGGSVYERRPEGLLIVISLPDTEDGPHELPRSAPRSGA
jgi:hypothetical protein